MLRLARNDGRETKKACRHLRRQTFVAAESSATITQRNAYSILMDRKTARQARS